MNARPWDRDARSLHNPQRLVDLFEETVDALFVGALGALGGFEDFEVNADGCGEMHEGLKTFGKQKPLKPKPARKNWPPMRGSSPMAWVTSWKSAPSFSQRSAMTLA